MSGRALTAAIAFCAAAVPVGAQQPARPITVAETEAVLADLIGRYGVSGAEGPVRGAVLRRLPGWVRSDTDSAGNLLVRVGQGGPLVVFIAHLDEIGFAVTAVRDDGTLDLAVRGGLFPSLFEGRPALVHAIDRTVPGIFLPRPADSLAMLRRTPPPLRVDVGAASRAEAESLGVAVGSTVTMPKAFVRLAGTRATGRSFDDRVGAAALLLALGRLDPRRLRHQVLFVWSVREEIGLEGAGAVAAALGTSVARVHAIDTFVSSDAPLDPKSFAFAPLGRGPVARALDGSGATPPAYVDSLRAIARAHRIPLQVGTTGGGNDGSTFLPYGAVNVPIGWPLRYSHSPAETIDLRDAAALAELIRAVAEEW